MDNNKNSLDKLKSQRDKLSAKIQKMEVLEKERERKRDTRRKILIGAYYIDKAINEGTIEQLYQSIQNYLTRESDKILFNALSPDESSASKIGGSIQT